MDPQKVPQALAQLEKLTFGKSMSKHGPQQSAAGTCMARKQYFEESRSKRNQAGTRSPWVPTGSYSTKTKLRPVWCLWTPSRTRFKQFLICFCCSCGIITIPSVRPNFFRPSEIFPAENFSSVHNFSGQKFFRPKNFWQENLFFLEKFYRAKIFPAKKFYRPKLFPDRKF